jgi:hypothetical protein
MKEKLASFLQKRYYPISKQGACHVHCHVTFARNQEENKHKTKEMPVLQGNDHPGLGEGEETSARYTDAECNLISISMLLLPENVPALPKWH